MATARTFHKSTSNAAQTTQTTTVTKSTVLFCYATKKIGNRECSARKKRAIEINGIEGFVGKGGIPISDFISDTLYTSFQRTMRLCVRSSLHHSPAKS